MPSKSIQLQIITNINLDLPCYNKFKIWAFEKNHDILSIRTQKGHLESV